MMWHLYDTEGNVVWSCDHAVASASMFIQAALQADVNLSHTDLTRTCAQWPTELRELTHMNWSDQDLTSCNAVHVNFSHGVFHRCILRDMRATRADFTSCDFSGAILDAGSFEYCDFSHSVFETSPQQGVRARHVLRPHKDEFLPFDRVLARSANFVHAQFISCVFVQVNFMAAVFEYANLSYSILEKCNFEGSVFEQTRLTGCMVFACDLITATLCRCITDTACFRGNEYFEMPVPKTIADASWAFPRQLITYVKEEWAHWNRMGAEVRQDYLRQICIKLLIMLSVPLMVLIAWKYVETNWVVSMLTAVGAVSTWALRRYVTMILQAAGGWLLGKVNHAEGLWKMGYRKAALTSLISSQQPHEHIKKRMQDELKSQRSI